MQNYIRNSFVYKRLSNLEEKELEVIWLKIMPKKLPRQFYCILIACIYFTEMTEYAKMRDYLITCVDQSRAGVLWMYLITSTSTFHHEST